MSRTQKAFPLHLLKAISMFSTTEKLGNTKIENYTHMKIKKKTPTKLWTLPKYKNALFNLSKLNNLIQFSVHISRFFSLV